MATPAEIRQHVWTVERNLDAHVQYILGAARACRPGGDKSWDGVLAHYGQERDQPFARLAAMQRLGQTRGAIVDEVRRALGGMSRQAETELDRVVPRAAAGGCSFLLASQDPQLETEVARLRAKLAGIAENASAGYQREVADQGKTAAASVGSIFANAMATAKDAPWANQKIDPAKVRECPNCGAPQEVVLEFTCRYCKSPMV